MRISPERMPHRRRREMHSSPGLSEHGGDALPAVSPTVTPTPRDEPLSTRSTPLTLSTEQSLKTTPRWMMEPIPSEWGSSPDWFNLSNPATVAAHGARACEHDGGIDGRHCWAGSACSELDVEDSLLPPPVADSDN